MRDGVDAARRGEPLGRVHHHIGVDDCHIGHQLVVREGIFHARLLVGDDREGSHFAARTGRGGDCDEVRLFAHLGEGVHALPDVHKAHGKVHKVDLGMFVEHPHNLAGVHSRAAAYRYDAVGLESAHRRGAFLGAGEGGVGRDVEERGVRDSHLVELVGDGLRISIMIQKTVRDNKSFLFSHDVFKFVEGDGQAALLYVHLFGCSEPQHILSPFRYRFDVDEVFDAHVFADAVAAPAAAAEGEGGREFEVVKVADAALRGGSVDEYAAGLHTVGVFVNLGLLRHRVDIERCGVAVAAVRDEVFRLVESVLEILGSVHREHGGEFFVRELFGDVDAGHFADDNLGVFGNGHAREFRDFGGFLTHDFRVESAVDDYGLAHFVRFFGVEEIASARLEFLLDFVVDLVKDDDGLFGRANHSVVESLGMDDAVDGKQDVRGVVDDGGSVARAHADCGFAAGIRRLDHSGTARRENDVRLFHKQVGHFEGRDVNPADDAFGRASFDRRFQHDFRRLDGALFGSRMGADDDAVSGFQRDERLEDGGGSGVGGGDDRADDAHGLGNLLDAEGLVFFDDAAGPGVTVGVVDIFGGVVVLDYFVFNHAHSRFGDCHFGKRDTLLIRGGGGSKEDCVHLLLRVLGEFFLSLAHASDGCFQFLDVVDDFILFALFHDWSPVCCFLLF